MMTADEYLYETPESNCLRELTHGMVREPAAPFFAHQVLVLRIAQLWSDYVEPRQLGRVAVAPVDVVLDRALGLIVQPDVLFVSTPRLSIIRNQIWGPPDLVTEVLSLGTTYRDRVEKLEWYGKYGVREYWLVDPFSNVVSVVDFSGPSPVWRHAKGTDAIRSTVLPDLEVSAFGLFTF